MSQTNPNSWWSRSTTDERLAQIDGGIELGMPARLVAFNCGTVRHTLHSFAMRYGRSFPQDMGHDSQKLTQDIMRNGSVATRRLGEAYLSGEPVDMWAAQ